MLHTLRSQSAQRQITSRDRVLGCQGCLSDYCMTRRPDEQLHNQQDISQGPQCRALYGRHYLCTKYKYRSPKCRVS